MLVVLIVLSVMFRMAVLAVQVAVFAVAVLVGVVLGLTRPTDRYA